MIFLLMKFTIYDYLKVFYRETQISLLINKTFKNQSLKEQKIWVERKQLHEKKKSFDRKIQQDIEKSLS